MVAAGINRRTTKSLGIHMRKAALLLAALLAVSFTTVADAAKKKEAPKPDPAIAAQKQSEAFIRDMFCPFCIAAATPAAKPAAAKPAKKSAKKSGKKSNKA
jgi:hypothetical protein